MLVDHGLESPKDPRFIFERIFDPPFRQNLGPGLYRFKTLVYLNKTNFNPGRIYLATSIAAEQRL